jgi:transcriptional regulator with XRE-family HTH domain
MLNLTQAGETPMNDAMTDDDGVITSYGRRVGERLRSIRRQKRLSLQEVEAASKQEFKASVLGAYERGERAISVPRLQRLARFYSVPVDQLLPNDDGPAFDVAHERPSGPESKIIIDLTKLEAKPGAEYGMLSRYLRMIQVQRQDFNGRVLTVRSDDLRAIACILDVPAEGTVRKLDDLGLRFQRV